MLHPLAADAVPARPAHQPVPPRQRELGAFFLETGGWERPHWYAANEPLLAVLPAEWLPPAPTRGRRYWSPIASGRGVATRDRVALFDMTALKRLEVTAPARRLPRAADHRQRRPQGGAVTYCLLLDDHGGIRSDVTVARLGPELFQVGANGNHRPST